MKVLEKQIEFMKQHGLLINTETEDPVIRDHLWLSEMLEAGFISKLIITSKI